MVVMGMDIMYHVLLSVAAVLVLFRITAIATIIMFVIYDGAATSHDGV